MTADRDLVVETVRAILSAHPPFVETKDQFWDHDLWRELAQAGLTGVGMPEDAGGSGGELSDAVAVVRTVAAGGGGVPIAEQLLVAGPAVVAAAFGVPMLEEPLTFHTGDSVSAVRVGNGWEMRGTAADVAWAGAAVHLVTLAAGPDGPVLAQVVLENFQVDSTTNLGGEPRGTLALHEVPAEAVAPLTEAQALELRARFALARAVQMSAALEQVLEWTVQYAGERQQFGRPIGKFQAVQMELAEMAGEVAAVTALTDAAVQALDRGENVVLASAAAKVRAGQAVEVVARRAHQVHGAIGFTQEHKLHHLTRRLWAWRDEAGSERHWSGLLANGVLARGADDLWPALTRVV